MAPKDITPKILHETANKKNASWYAVFIENDNHTYNPPFVVKGRNRTDAIESAAANGELTFDDIQTKHIITVKIQTVNAVTWRIPTTKQ